jgi:hypothetical protein
MSEVIRNDKENELYNLGVDIKKAFVSCMTKFNKQKDRGDYRLLKQYDSYEKIWKKAAEVCSEYKISPELLVDIALETYLGSSKHRTIITPVILYDIRTKYAIKNHIASKAESMDIGSSDSMTYDDLYKQELKSYINSRFDFLNSLKDCQTRISKQRVLHIVRMQAFDIPSWLRVIVTDGDDPIVNKRFGSQAIYELQEGIKGLKEELESRGTNVDDIIRKLKSTK